jgi:nitroreductase
MHEQSTGADTDTLRRLTLPLGEVIGTQRSIRRFRPDPLAAEDLHVLMAAAVRAPNGGNRQPTRFLVLTERDRIRRFGALYREAWWAKRRDEGRPWRTRDEIPLAEAVSRSAARLADEMQDAPCIVLALSLGPGQASSVLPAVQNLMLAARALGIGSVPTTLHPDVTERVRALLGIPREAELHLCIPLGYPRGRFGPTRRLPTAETTFFEHWAAPPPWA